LFGDGNLKKIAGIIVTIAVLSFICTQLPVEGRITLWPAKLNINMESFPDEPIIFKQVQVKNPEGSAVTVRPEVSHPSETGIKEGYSRIPDLSWVTVSPHEMVIPAKSEGFFNITIDIPKSNQSQLYNERWEVLALFYQKQTSPAGVFNFRVKLGSRIFIHTPSGMAEQQAPSLYVFFWFVIMGGLALATAVFYFRRKRATKIDRAAMFYVKEKDRKHHKRKKF